MNRLFILLPVVFLTLAVGEAQAACSPVASGNGQTINCTGDDTTNNVGGGFDDITVNIADGATLLAPTNHTILLGDGGLVTNGGGIAMNAGFDAIHITGDNNTVINNHQILGLGGDFGVSATGDNNSVVNNGTMLEEGARVELGEGGSYTNNGLVNYTLNDGSGVISVIGDFTNTGTMNMTVQALGIAQYNSATTPNISFLNSGTVAQTDGAAVDVEVNEAGTFTFTNAASGVIAIHDTGGFSTAVDIHGDDAGAAVTGVNNGQIQSDGVIPTTLVLDAEFGHIDFTNNGWVLIDSSAGGVGLEMIDGVTFVNAAGAAIGGGTPDIAVLIEGDGGHFTNQQGASITAGLSPVLICDCAVNAVFTNAGAITAEQVGGVGMAVGEAEDSTFTNTASGVVTGGLFLIGTNNTVTNNGVWNMRVGTDDSEDMDTMRVGATTTFDTSGGVLRIIRDGSEIMFSSETYVQFIDRTDSGAGTLVGLAAGTSAALQSANPLIDASLAAAGANFNLVLTRRAFNDPAGGTLTAGQQHVADVLEDGYLDALGGDPSADPAELDNALQNITSFSSYAAALSALEGGFLASAGVDAATVMGEAFQNLLLERLGSLFTADGGTFIAGREVRVAYAGNDFGQFFSGDMWGKESDAWMKLHGSWANMQADAGDITLRDRGVSAGLDRAIGDHGRAGVAVDYTEGTTQQEGNAGQDDISSYRAAVYGGWQDGNWQFTGLADYAFSQNATVRNVALGGITLSPEGRFDAHEVGAAVEANYVYMLGGTRLRPGAGLAYQGYVQEGFKERAGGGANLDVDSFNVHALRPSVSASLSQDFAGDDHAVFTPELRGKVQYDVLDQDREVSASLAGSAGSFSTKGEKPGAASAVVGAGLTASLPGSFRLYFNYDADLHANLTSHSISGGAKLEF